MDDAASAPQVKITRFCVYCHDVVDATDDRVHCAACLAIHHAECFREHGRCAAPGCEERRIVRAAAADARPPGKRARRRRPVRACCGLLAAALAGGVVGAATTSDDAQEARWEAQRARSKVWGLESELRNKQAEIDRLEAERAAARAGEGVGRDAEAARARLRELRAEASRPMIGVNIDSSAPDGIRITELLPDTHAREAGLSPGDVLFAFEGDGGRAPLDELADLQEALARHAPGDEVDVWVRRAGRELRLRVELSPWRLEPAEQAELERLRTEVGVVEARDALLADVAVAEAVAAPDLEPVFDALVLGDPEAAPALARREHGPAGRRLVERVAFDPGVASPRDPATAVRQRALDALWAVDARAQPSPPRLRRYLGEARGLRRDAALERLGEVDPSAQGRPAATGERPDELSEALRTVAASDLDPVAAAWACRRLGAADLAVMVDVVRLSPHPAACAAAAEGLGALRARDAVAALVAAREARAHEPVAATAILSALRTITESGPPAGDSPGEWRLWWYANRAAYPPQLRAP